MGLDVFTVPGKGSLPGAIQLLEAERILSLLEDKRKRVAGGRFHQPILAGPHCRIALLVTPVSLNTSRQGERRGRQ